MKKLISLLTATMLLFVLSSAFALEETVLPFGLRYNMTEPEIVACLEKVGNYELYSDEDFSDYNFENLCDVVGSLAIDSCMIEISRNNSPREKQFSYIDLSLPIEGNPVSAYRAALAQFTLVYGEPDSNPFEDVQNYVEYGSLDATWTKQDVYITLILSRIYSDNLSACFNRRICFDAEDLNE